MKLGRVQQQVLALLKQHGSWHYGCSWKFMGPKETQRVLNSLAERGLVHRTYNSTPPRGLIYISVSEPIARPAPVPAPATYGEVRAVLLTIAEVLESPRDRYGRIDFLHLDQKRARETIRNFAAKYAIGTVDDVLDQAAKVARAVLRR